MPRQQPRIKVGQRTVVAMTCWGCGGLLPGAAYSRFPRVPGGPAYLDRRCNARCRWKTMAGSVAR